ncbi:MAG: NADH-quinone oxidoreductase subunit N [Verrucomicrobiota bacterium]|jgi:NADH-quinone oxidoreductase subunit N
MSYLQLLQLAAPETLVVIAALGVLGADLLALRGLESRFRRIICALIACAGCAAAIGWMAVLPHQANFLQGMLVVDPITRLVKIGLLVLTVFNVLLSVETDFTPHVGEYFALVLFGTVGMMFLVSAEDLLMIFICLELTSLSLYILTAFDKRNVQSTEAALKFFLLGSVAAAFTLFGVSLLYGIAGSTNLGEIARAAASNAVRVIEGEDGSVRRLIDPLLAGAIVMTVIGLGFKVAAAPFHLWAPDAYQGAPIPSAAFIASASKVAGFFIFAKVMSTGFAGVEGSGAWLAFRAGWVPLLAVLAGASMVLGNLAALVQSSVRRLLAYSAVAHAGYMLLGVMSGAGAGLAPLLYYALTYSLSVLGAFGVVSIVRQRAGGDRLADFAGLSRRAPALSFCMLIFMLSLAGIPPLAGFFGKFYLFSAALGAGAPHLGLLWLVGLAIVMSAVSLYYYLQVLKQIYVVETPAAPGAHPAPVTEWTLVVLAGGVVALGCAPGLLTERLAAALRATGI